MEAESRGALESRRSIGGLEPSLLKIDVRAARQRGNGPVPRAYYSHAAAIVSDACRAVRLVVIVRTHAQKKCKTWRKKDMHAHTRTRAQKKVPRALARAARFNLLIFI